MNKKYCYPSNFLALKFLQILIGSVDFFFFRTFFFFEYAKRILRRVKLEVTIAELMTSKAQSITAIVKQNSRQ